MILLTEPAPEKPLSVISSRVMSGVKKLAPKLASKNIPFVRVIWVFIPKAKFSFPKIVESRITSEVSITLEEYTLYTYHCSGKLFKSSAA